MSNILVTRSSMPSFEEYCEEIKEIWNSHWLTNMGVKHKELQKELENYLGISHVVLYTNGHLALENAIAALNLPKGGEVITTPFTFASTTHAIVRNGLVPVFCDIKEDDYTIDTQKLENLITDNTVAIVPVHVYGNMCDVEEINRISKKYGLKVIYDAAHAFAVKYKGESSACFGDASMFSFHATKVFNTIEGGCVCFKDDSWIQLLNDMKNFGIHGPESVQFVGANAKMNEFQAAMGICNLKHLDEEIEKRKHVVEHYRSRLEGVEGIKLSIIQKDVESNYAYFPVVFDGYKYTRNEIFEKLVEVGIGARKYFYPLTNSFECYRNYPTAGAEKTPIAQHIGINENMKCVTVNVFAKEGTIAKIQGLEEIAKMPDCTLALLHGRVGEQCKADKAILDKICVFAFSSESVEQLKNDVDEAYSKLQIIDDMGNDMIYDRLVTSEILKWGDGNLR